MTPRTRQKLSPLWWHPQWVARLFEVVILSFMHFCFQAIHTVQVLFNKIVDRAVNRKPCYYLENQLQGGVTKQVLFIKETFY